jgi:plasmid stabilization system protein ParE
MALEVFWSKKADLNFDSIIDYLQSEWGESSIKLFVKKVYEILDLLIEYPEIGSLEYQELNIRKIVIVKQITLFYQVRDEKLILLNFYNNKQNPKEKRF